jgi:hypothetical protein
MSLQVTQSFIIKFVCYITIVCICNIECGESLLFRYAMSNMEKVVKFLHMVMYTALELSSSSCLQEHWQQGSRAEHPAGNGGAEQRQARF